ncbi:glutathione S-transferase family protein [Fulvimarina sp. 2208YS6-2-32]|uniref:Glutathione S-transferase family protein n=1 Tax=Fulvimarina uroteuthidis TaxID=3098149 RepID=A0ABU5HXH5_9HYPH|nr:glutathione S-transferase family protein [Fulvimarina sp. 2208YS6-2-32]MDY8107577.1 glutathione S-transferase family protein [Fulvimarina sp. 2208YS6-2-32]
MITLYGMPDSGNCYKPRLLCALTGRAFRHVQVSMLDGGTRTPGYLAMNPNGKVPLLRTGDGRFLPESNAILTFLGEGTRFMPDDAFTRAEMFAWMFFEQYSHEPTVAVRRSLMIYPDLAADATAERLAETLEGGGKALAVMEGRLAQAEWLAGDAPSLADLCLYAYTHVAPEGGFELDAYPNLTVWLERVAGLTGFRPMDWLPDD